MTENIVTERKPPSPLTIARAVRPGTRRAPSQRAWLKDVHEAMGDAGWRTDRLENWQSVARIVAYRADWRTRCTMPTWDRLGRLCGRHVDANGERRPLSRSTVARVLSWLGERGFLGTVETGSTPWLRPMALSGTEGNRAAVYVLTTPGRQAARRVIRVNDTPSGPRRGLGKDLRASARESGKSRTKTRPPGTHPKGRRPSPRPPVPAAAPPLPPPALFTDRKPSSPLKGRPAAGGAWPKREVPENRTEEAAAAAAVMKVSAAARALTDRHVAHICRDFFRAGWSPAAVIYAIDHKPGGEQWHFRGPVDHPAQWLAWCLGHWRQQKPAEDTMTEDDGTATQIPPRIAPGTGRASFAASARAAAGRPGPQRDEDGRQDRAARIPPERTRAWGDYAREQLAAARRAAAEAPQ